MTCARNLRENHSRSLEKHWRLTKPTHPVRCARLKTQRRSRTINILYLVVRREFTPLLGCYACLDLEVLKFMNLDLIEHSDTDRKSQKAQPRSVDLIKTDAVLREFQDCLSKKPGRLPNHVSLGLDRSASPAIHPPRKISIAPLEPAKEKF